MAYNTHPSNFVDLLNSQQDTVFELGEDTVFGTQQSEEHPNVGDTPSGRKERRTWTHTDDIVLISSWLNTSKDPLVGNEQRSDSFWKRIAAYFAASPKIGVGEEREHGNCKQRWHMINDQVSKFCGTYEKATRLKTSGQNDNDVLKASHEIFLNNYKKKFTLEHAWKELRYDQKWCSLSTSKTDRSSKRRKCDEGAQSSASHASETNTGEPDVNIRPPGVKAAKGYGKKTKAGKVLAEYQGMWEIKKEELTIKANTTKMKLLERLFAKPEPLTESEEVVKNKLINELFN
ncbi:glutathione S-transferase T3-like [Raphanus sativus]|uniref:Glutathione S-transferase T3-like n=1 Tax=Raphanus sativus TaxID=3726 RepID=A0A9W3DKT5_RAPSA|nr:glutathione S-transferase T3-like [Raphanus sativus]